MTSKERDIVLLDIRQDLNNHIKRTDLLEGQVNSMTNSHKVLSWAIGIVSIIFLGGMGWLMAIQTLQLQNMLN